MCGIAGYIGAKQTRNTAAEKILSDMCDSLEHRGPDSKGYFIDKSVGVFLGHRRLAIHDLSPQGSQPMTSWCGRYVIAYNGEIYNFLELRIDLSEKGRKFHGTSDTEILINAIAEYGLDATLEKLVGMFAFSVFDRNEGKLYLVRDRLGEKPLYYAMLNGQTVFGSELKSLVCHPDWEGKLNYDVLGNYMRCGYVAAPQSIYQNCYSLLPGTYVVFDIQSNSKVLEKKYWDIDKIAYSCSQDILSDERQAMSLLDDLLTQSVSQKLLADVPVGAFLSGGVDSSLIVAKMCEIGTVSPKTFTIGFEEQDFNEAHHAKAISKYLKTDHTETYLTAKDSLAVIESLPDIYDEPFADSSQIPTILLSGVVRSNVTVALSGDGGDELFGGYNRYSWLQRYVHLKSKYPSSILNLVGKGMSLVNPSTINSMSRRLPSRLSQKLVPRSLGEKILKVSHLLTSPSLDEAYHRLTTVNPRYKRIFSESISSSEYNAPWPHSEAMMCASLWDQRGYLPGDILTKIDRAAMASSLETRIPFLDHRLVEFSWHCSPELKLANGQSKSILRKLLYQKVPKELIERPKSGFGVPIDRWLRGQLKNWAEDLLFGVSATKDIFNNIEVEKLWKEHQSKRANHQHALWTILMFLAWFDRYKPSLV